MYSNLMSNIGTWCKCSFNMFLTFCSVHKITMLQLESLRGRLDEREDLLKQKEKKLISVSSEHSENSYAVENLQSILSTKERQITSLKQKVANSIQTNTETGLKEKFLLFLWRSCSWVLFSGAVLLTECPIYLVFVFLRQKTSQAQAMATLLAEWAVLLGVAIKQNLLVMFRKTRQDI